MRCVPFTYLNTGVTKPKFTKFQNGDIAICFGMPGQQIMVNSPILTLKLVAVAMSLDPLKKGVKSVTYNQIPTTR